MNLSILSIALMLCLCCYSCQKNQQKQIGNSPNIKKHKTPFFFEFQENLDSAQKWHKTIINELSVFNRLEHRQYLELSLYDLNDSFFYNQPDSVLEYQILNMVSFDILPQYIKNKSNMDSAVIIAKNALSTVELPLIEDQIWDDEPRFVINPLAENPFQLKQDIPCIHLDSINKLDLTGNYFDYKDNLNTLLLYFDRLKNERLGTSLSFKVLIRMAENNHPFVYQIADTIVKKCIRSQEMSYREKAGFILGAAKILGGYPDDMYWGSIHGWLKLAQGYCELNPEDSVFLHKLKIITYKNILQAETPWSDDLLELAYYDQRLTFMDDELTYSEKEFQDLLRITQYELLTVRRYFQKNGVIGNKKCLGIASQLYILNKYFKRNAVINQLKYQYEYLVLLSEYYRLRLKLDNALSCLYKALEIQLSSEDTKFQMSFMKTVGFIELLLKDKGEDIVFLHDLKTPYIKPTFLFQIPRDSRLWSERHYDTLKSYLKYKDISGRWFTRNLFRPYLEQELDDVLKKIGLHEIKRNNSREAYYFFAKADSIINEWSVLPSLVSDESRMYQSLAQKTLLEKQVRDRSQKFLITLIAGISIALIAIYAWYERSKSVKAKNRALEAEKKAQESEANERISAYTISQTGHLGPLCIHKILLKNTISQENTGQLENLSLLLRDFYDYYLQKRITFDQELYLILDYINLAFTDDEMQEPGCALKLNIDEKTLSKLEVPMFVMFNAVQNAFNYGKINCDEGHNVEINIIEQPDIIEVSVKNKLNPYTESKKRGTGINYMKTVLKEWNKGKINNVLTPDISDDYYTLTYKFIPRWNTR